MRDLFLLLFFNTLCFVAFPQKHNLKFGRVDVNSGLSQSNVLCILQDSRGFMWFGTPDGLNKYDGYKVTVYRKNSKNTGSLSHNYINDIIEGNNGDLWITTWGGGLNHYNRQSDEFTHLKHDLSSQNSLSGNFLGSLVKDIYGKLWIASERGIDVYDPEKKLFRHYKNNPDDESSLSDNSVTCMMEDSQHNLWIGTTNGGLNMFDRKKNTFIHYRHNEVDISSISSDNIWTIAEDRLHNIWVGTVGGGLNALNRSTGKFRAFKKNITGNSICDNVIFSLTEDNRGLLWIGSENGGISTLNPETGIFNNYAHNLYDNSSVSSSSINRIYKDRKGNIWIGTFNAGVNFLSTDINAFTHYKHNFDQNSLSNNNVMGIYEDATGLMWIGTDGGGVNIFDRKKDNFSQFKHQDGNENSLAGNYVVSITGDGDGNIWIGTYGNGISVYDRQRNTYKQYLNNPDDPHSLTGNNAWVVFRDHEQNMWAGVAGGGLCRYDKAKDHFIRYTRENSNLSSNNIVSIFEDKSGVLWIGTDGGGLNAFNWKIKKVTTFGQSGSPGSLSDNTINCIFEDKAGALWLGTNDGLNYLDKSTGLFTLYTTKNGLPNDLILGILEDSKNNLWISTNKGISRFTPATKTFKNFSIADGLQSNEFKQSYFKSRSGLMYFGGINGFNEFDPDSIQQIDFEPPLVLTDFRIANRQVPVAVNTKDASPLKQNITEATSITLPYSSSFFSFEFASINFVPEEDKRYAYMLEGFDKTWNEVGTQRSATYTNLDPGKYVFRVKGLNNEGQWSSRMIAITLDITPPFWLTWWFKLLAILIIAGGVTGVYKFRLRTINIQKRKLEERVLEQTQQLHKSTQDEQKARREAEQANINLQTKNKELEQFTYIASHDLQEPLRTTSSFASLLQKQYRGQLDDRADKYFHYIMDASERMKLLIKSLLDYSRIGNNKEIEEVDCNTILKNVLDDLHVAIQEANADINYTPLPVINGYPTELKQLFQNLLINAIKFKKSGTSPRVNISAQQVKNDWRFKIEDNGIGIEERHLEKIFNIFQRLHSRTEYEGSGIGLSYCKKIVELHNGKIWVTSILGAGSTFYFILPAGELSGERTSLNAKLTSGVLNNG